MTPLFTFAIFTEAAARSAALFFEGPVKGFAVTLCLGIVTTVFTAVFATRVYYDFRLAQRRLATISV